MTSAPVPGSVLVYDRIAANRRMTWVLMVAFVAILTALVAAIVLVAGLPIGFVGVAGVALIVYALFSYFAASRVVLSFSGAHEVTKEQEWEYVRRVENLAIGAGLPTPRTWVIEDSAPNAFATGRDPQHAHVVVTRGLLDKLEPIELEAVLAHELSHIGNYDIRVMTIATVLVGVVVLLSDFLLRWTYWGAGARRGSRQKGGGGAAILVIVALVAAIIAPIVAQALKFAISRRREFLADASGALLVRHPEALARALEKISADPEPLEAANKATAHLYIYNPLREHRSFLNSLFNTHPPIEERVRLLRSM
jgi:heat shock protein HtpX